MRKFVAHTVVRSQKIILVVGRLRPGLFVHRGRGVYTGEGGLHIALVDWQTDLYNCILILSQAVGPARDLNGSTPLVCG